jgi:hypothetical protein
MGIFLEPTGSHINVIFLDTCLQTLSHLQARRCEGHVIGFLCLELTPTLLRQDLEASTCWAISLHMEVCWQPNISPRSLTRINRWSRFTSNRLCCLLQRQIRRNRSHSWWLRLRAREQARMWLLL